MSRKHEPRIACPDPRLKPLEKSIPRFAPSVEEAKRSNPITVAMLSLRLYSGVIDRARRAIAGLVPHPVQALRGKTPAPRPAVPDKKNLGDIIPALRGTTGSGSRAWPQLTKKRGRDARP
jgi:hypothetical protein